MERALRDKLPAGRFLKVRDVTSRTMVAIRGRGNITTERRLRLALVRAGIRGWMIQPGGLAGHPDFYFPVTKLAVFTDGCFWHGCAECGHTPKTNSGYWREKLARNRARDQRTEEQLRFEGLEVMRFWEHELIAEIEMVVAKISSYLATCEGT